MVVNKFVLPLHMRRVRYLKRAARSIGAHLTLCTDPKNSQNNSHSLYIWAQNCCSVALSRNLIWYFYLHLFLLYQYFQWRRKLRTSTIGFRITDNQSPVILTKGCFFLFPCHYPNLHAITRFANTAFSLYCNAITVLKTKVLPVKTSLAFCATKGSLTFEHCFLENVLLLLNTVHHAPLPKPWWKDNLCHSLHPRVVVMLCLIGAWGPLTSYTCLKVMTEATVTFK